MGRDLKKALVLFEAGEHRAAVKLFQALLLRKPSPADADVIHVRLGRALLEIGKRDDAGARGPGRGEEGLGRRAGGRLLPGQIQSRRASSPAAYGSVATRFPGTSWGEEALLDGAAFYARSGKDDEALPFYRRIYEGYPQGKYIDPATFRVGFARIPRRPLRQGGGDLRGRGQDARLEPVAAGLPVLGGARAPRAGPGGPRAGPLRGSAGPLQVRLPRHPRARGAGPPARGRVVHASRRRPDGLAVVPEPYRTRVRNLLLIDRLDEAMDELSSAPPQPDRAGHAELDLLAAGPAPARPSRP